jgi:hypothetical protein
MANALTTVIQCTLFQYIKSEMEDDIGSSLGIDALFYNDDCSIGIEDHETLLQYLDHEDRIFSELGLIRNLKKSHVGPLLQFCERYYFGASDCINKKSSYSRTELYNCFAGQNIVHAKLLAQSLPAKISLEGIDVDKITRELVEFWSYEFFPEEHTYPASFGGWWNPTYLGVRIDFLSEDLDFYNPQKAFFAIQEALPKKRPKKSRYSTPLSSYYDSLRLDKKSIPDWLSDHLHMGKSLGEVEELSGKWPRRETLEGAYRSLLSQRKKAFKCRQSRIFSKKELFNEMRRDFPERDIIPPIDYCKWVNVSLSDRKFNNRNPNPLLSAIRFYNPERYDNNSIVPEPFSALGYIPSKIKTSEQRKSLIYKLKTARGVYAWEASYYLDQWVDEELPHRFYKDPSAVLSAIEALTGHIKELPIFEGSEVFSETDIKHKFIIFNSEENEIIFRVRNSKFILNNIEFFREYREEFLSIKRKVAEPVVIEQPDDDEPDPDPQVTWDIEKDFWTWRDVAYPHYDPRAENSFVDTVFAGIQNELNIISALISMAEIAKEDIDSELRRLHEPTNALYKKFYVCNGGTLRADGDYLNPQLEFNLGDDDELADDIDALFGFD